MSYKIYDMATASGGAHDVSLASPLDVYPVMILHFATLFLSKPIFLCNQESTLCSRLRGYKPVPDAPFFLSEDRARRLLGKLYSLCSEYLSLA